MKKGKIMNKKNLLFLAAIYAVTSIHGADNYAVAISFANPKTSIKPDVSSNIYFFTKERISDADEVTSWLTSNLNDPKDISDLQNLCTTFDPEHKTFQVDAAKKTIRVHLETDCNVLSTNQLLGFIKKKCQKQKIAEFLGKSAQFIVTRTTLDQLVAIMKDPKVKCTCELEQ